MGQFRRRPTSIPWGLRSIALRIRSRGLGVALQNGDVERILRPPGGPLVRDQLRAADHPDVLVAVLGLDAIGPRGVESDAVDRGHQIHSIRWHADLQDLFLDREIGRRGAPQRRTEGAKRREIATLNCATIEGR